MLEIILEARTEPKAKVRTLGSGRVLAKYETK